MASIPPLGGVGFLFNLPAELLLMIAELAAHDLDGLDSGCAARECIKALSLTCKTLRRLAQPLLFRNIEFGVHHYRYTRIYNPTMRLHRTLEQVPHLRKYCRSLHVNVPDLALHQPEDFLISKDIVAWLTNTRNLTFQVGYPARDIGIENMESIWDLVRQISSTCKAIEHLLIKGKGDYLLIDHVFKRFNFPALKSLHLDSLKSWVGSNAQLSLEKRRTAPFTQLTVSEFGEDPRAMALLLQWPAALSTFHFLGSGISFTHRNHISSFTFQSWLLIHKDTLTHITIGDNPFHHHDMTNVSLFKASLYPNLEFLQLSRWQMRRPLHFCAEDACILGPSLKTFIWDFAYTGHYGHSSRWQDFGYDETAWLRRLAEMAVARNSTLEKIDIKFVPCMYEIWDDAIYPWDVIDSIRDDIFRPSGRNLTYDAPPWSKEHWLRCKKDKIKCKQPEWEGQCYGYDGYDEYDWYDWYGNYDGRFDQIDMAATDPLTDWSDSDEENDDKPETWKNYQGENIRNYLKPKGEIVLS